MAVSGSRVTVAATATLIASGNDSSHILKVIVRNADGSNAIDLGASGVTSGAGYSLLAAASVTLELGPGEALYGITASGNVVVHVLKTRAA